MVFCNPVIASAWFPYYVSWIETCLTTVTYRINVNGQLLKPFEGNRRMRQGTVDSVDKLLQQFEQFSMASRLVANRNKSEIYYAGLSQEKGSNFSSCPATKGDPVFQVFGHSSKYITSRCWKVFWPGFATGLTGC
ncbi:unnamed protein product [Lathyrus sativus]|nr:unnamed protein product [Lathyrus sativus]